MSEDTKAVKPWGGRFTEATDSFVERFTASVQFDQRLYHHDIQGSIAHATMLTEVGVLTDDEKTQIIDGLEAIRQDIEAGKFDWSITLEDVHMNIEAELTKRIGITGKSRRASGQTRRCDYARFHAPSNRSTGHLWPSPSSVERDAGT